MVCSEKPHNTAADLIRVGERAFPPSRDGPLQTADDLPCLGGVEEETWPLGCSKAPQERGHVVPGPESTSQNLGVRSRGPQLVLILGQPDAGAPGNGPGRPADS